MQTEKRREVLSGVWGVNEQGYYGNFGGAFIPEMLYPNVHALQENYLKIIYEENKHHSDNLPDRIH